MSNADNFESARAYQRLGSALAAIEDEVANAQAKHAPLHSLHEAHSVIAEEFDEFWDLVKLNPRKPMIHPTKGGELSIEAWRRELRQELIQTAAMCVRALTEVGSCLS